jgi:DUF1680 family protein
MRRNILPICVVSLIVLIFSGLAGCTHELQPGTIKAVPFTKVEITDAFWSPRLELNRTVSIPEMLEQYEQRGSSPSPKLVEAGAYLLAKNPDPALKKTLDAGISRLIDQLKSGDPQQKWKQLRNGELYVAGHFFEAAVAYYQATGDKQVLETACELADHIDSVFGPDKRHDVSGHEEVKIGLLKLYHQTGNDKYFQLAKFFLDERGYPHDGRELYGSYAQDHQPVVQQKEAVGHCVRATYLYTPLAEIAALTQAAPYARASRRIWEDVVTRKMYLMGNFGSHRDDEDFGEAYELPNLSGWNETCSAIGNVFWNHEMFLLEPDAKYIDVLERSLYNGFLVGVSLDGRQYFYQNVMQTFGDFERHPWFGPNCCPPNIVRLMASLGNYFYASAEGQIYINLFASSQAKVHAGDTVFVITQQTRYPWEGKITISIAPEQPAEMTLNVRIPGWARNEPVPGNLYRYADSSSEKPVLLVNGNKVDIQLKRGYAAIKRTWRQGDVIELNLPMPVRKVVAHKKVSDAAGKVALERGPLLYCAEAIDNNGEIFSLLVPDKATFKYEYKPDLLGGVAIITGTVTKLIRGADIDTVNGKEHQLTAIPYYVWASRQTGPMSVWLASEKAKVVLPPHPTLETSSQISCSCGQGTNQDNYPGGNVPDVARRFYPHSQSGSGSLNSICDQIEPVSSADGSCPYLRLRPQQGDRAWVQYDFPNRTKVSYVEVYWKDDTEYCLAPKSWRIVYWDGTGWQPVLNHQSYSAEKDKFNRVEFDPVQTERLRLEIQMQGKSFEKTDLGPPDANYLKESIVWYEGGILEWRIG